MEVIDSCEFSEILPFSVQDVDAIIGVSFDHTVGGYPFEDYVTVNSDYYYAYARHNALGLGLNAVPQGRCGGFTVAIRDRSDNSTPKWVTWDQAKGRLVIHPQTASIDLHQFAITVSLTEYPEVASTKYFDIEVT